MGKIYPDLRSQTLLVKYTESVLGFQAAVVSEITTSFGLKILINSHR